MVAPRSVFVTVLATLLPAQSSGRAIYVARLPNGANVAGINALGHIATAGGGTRNQFGLDFAAAGREWTSALCALDSDGDGQTNGQELGDPCCKWNATSNAVVLWSVGVSAPGNAELKSDASLWTSINCAGSSTTAPSSNSTTSSPTTSPTNSTAAPTPVPTLTPTPTTSGGSRPLASAASAVLATGFLAVALAVAL